MQRILIVDDEPTDLRRLQARLEQDGYEVTAVSSGAEALEKVAAQSPEVVVLGVALPDVDGFEVARRIRALRGGYQPTLILIHPRRLRLEVAALFVDPFHRFAEWRERTKRQAGAFSRGFSVAADCQLSKPLDLDLVSRYVARMFVSALPDDTPV